MVTGGKTFAKVGGLRNPPRQVAAKLRKFGSRKPAPEGTRIYLHLIGTMSRAGPGNLECFNFVQVI